MSKTGRFYIKSKSGKTWCVEPIDDTPIHKIWGDVDPVTGKLTGEYGMKDNYRGSITSDESIITKENGYDNIYWTKEGQDPISFIDALEKNQK